MHQGLSEMTDYNTEDALHEYWRHILSCTVCVRMNDWANTDKFPQVSRPRKWAVVMYCGQSHCRILHGVLPQALLMEILLFVVIMLHIVAYHFCLSKC